MRSSSWRTVGTTCARSASRIRLQRRVARAARHCALVIMVKSYDQPTVDGRPMPDFTMIIWLKNDHARMPRGLSGRRLQPLAPGLNPAMECLSSTSGFSTSAATAGLVLLVRFGAVRNRTTFETSEADSLHRCLWIRVAGPNATASPCQEAALTDAASIRRRMSGSCRRL
jgi:hypothetical protein